MHRTTIAKFVPVVCNKIYERLKDEYLTIPNTAEIWREHAAMALERWQIPNCIGAADGKHVSIQHPQASGSLFYNYKGFYSIVMLAIVDYDYKFIFVDVGCQGRISDGGVYRNSSFYTALESGALNLPEPKPLPLSSDPPWIFDQSSVPIPHYIVADDAFPLGQHCMKPFSQVGLTDRRRIFNYRISRMRRISENVFAIWASRFRVFATTMALAPDKAVDIALASVALRNLLREKSRESYTPSEFIDDEMSNGDIRLGAWRSDDQPIFTHSLPKTKSSHSPKSAEKVRNILADHFYGPGQIPWQWNVLL